MSKKCLKYHFNTAISPLNKIGKFMSFTKDDKVLSDFIDYMSFYTSWNFAPLTKILSSDNGPSLYLGRLTIDRIEKKQGLFRGWVSTVYMGYTVKVCLLQEVKIKDKIVLKIDLYGKGLKLIREDSDLWKSLNIFFRDRLCLGEDLTITRIDYTVDCMKINFRKENNLRCRVSGIFTKDGQTKTKYFGKRGHDTAMFIRYYDKKEEISVRGTSMLYPEYQFLPCVMRYELQVNSKGFDPCERIIKYEDLYSVINLGYHIQDNSGSHKKQKDEDLLNDIVLKINQLKLKNDFESLDKICVYLDSLYRKNNKLMPLYSPIKGDFD